MSRKRRRKNRPRNGPSHKPSRQRRPQKPEVQTAMSIKDRILGVLGLKGGAVDKTRRKLLIGGTAAAVTIALGAVAYKIFGGEETPGPPVQKRILKKPEAKPKTPDISRLPEYDEWASKIALPKVKIGDKYSDWPSEKYTDIFKPANVKINQERIDEFCKMFLALKQDIFQKVEAAQHPLRRMGLISNFYHELVRHYALMTNDSSASRLIFGSPESIRLIHRMNRYLIPRGHFLWQNNTSRDLVNFAFFEVDGFKSLTIEYKDQSKEIPIVVLKNQQEVNTHVNKPATVHSGASYEEDGEYITMQSKLLSENFQMLDAPGSLLKSKKALTDYLHAFLFHEAMHAVLHEPMGISTWGHGAIKFKGNIKMPDFLLAGSGYRNKDNSNLHELGGNGYGLMNSGEGAHEMAKIIFQGGYSEDDYELAFQTLITQITYSPIIDEKFASTLIKANMENNSQLFYDLFIQAIQKYKPEELHYFGEQMAKLAIYLAQEDK